ncbi:MAG: AraC family transcriptional regulator [Bacteroides sp.]|nr:AraC family transcriptional regulator [Roseburia sp.]MCM1347273.1 AraC family transcriptional regulator [Bacteroides sp.]MCM1421079.1 AraC family transcriptional regulator [Bacteroides sp.]
MESKIRNIETIAEYNSLLGMETLHPLVSVINLANAQKIRHQRHTFGFYTIFLKEAKCGDIIYGRKYYDYQEGTVVCLAPGQVIGIEDNGETIQPRGWALCFHPDIIRGTSLGSHIKEYSFFSYEVNEALHLSQKEREIFTDCLQKIHHELEHNIDRLSRKLIATNIELLLDYCLRFYERQFITRETVNRDILVRFESLLDTYFDEGKAKTEGLPSVKWCAGELCLSSNYFGDLIKKETGKTAHEHIQLKLINIAKERIHNSSYSISQISYELGFQYPQHFTRLFKKMVGMTPNKYRTISAV